ncbi:MAG: YdbL family protein [Oceanospirillaceae bacterium]|nr:YdbL family protein [Oceanospirillaceae bacterium]
MNKAFSTIAALLLLISFSTFSAALSMDQAKAQGLIGETSSGYLGSVKSGPSAAVANLIKSINVQRKAAFATKATKAGVSVSVMAKRVAQRLFQKAAKGAYLQSPAGKWYKK